MKKTVFDTNNKADVAALNGPVFGGHGISLVQVGKDNFVVRYGLQVDERLTYGQACAKLGQALMHNWACEGKLDNRMKGER